MYTAILKFIICAGLILFAGKHVAKYADVIAEKTGLSRVWIGIILVAFATSLPEAFTGVGSVVFVDAPDITIGNIFGANTYNLLNIVLLDFLCRQAPLLSTLSAGLLLTAAFSLVPVMLAALGIILSKSGYSVWSAGNVGIFSIAILISYFVAVRVIYNFEKKRQKQTESRESKYTEISLEKAYLYFGLAALVIMVSGIWLAYIGKELSYIFGLNQSFVGSLFIGFATTLPEITVSVAALFLGAKEIAVANMLGSNLFNLMIVFIDDLLYIKGPILKAVSFNHVYAALAVMVMTAVVIMGLVIRSKRKFLRMGWYAPVLIIIFLACAYINFSMR